MKTTVRTFANFLAQVLLLIMLALYVGITYHAYSLNLAWLIVALLLGTAGFFLKPLKALVLTFFIVLIYGGLLLYRFNPNAANATMEWNDLIWLFIFPLFSLIGGIHDNRVTQIIKPSMLSKPFEEDEERKSEVEMAPFPEFVGLPGFIDILRKRLIDKHLVTVLLIQIEGFLDLQKDNSEDSSGYFLQKVAEIITEKATAAETKAYLEDGIFGLILTTKEPFDMNTLKNQLSEAFNLLILSRSRREGNTKLILIYGSADSPWQGKDVTALMTTAREELKYSSSI